MSSCVTRWTTWSRRGAASAVTWTSLPSRCSRGSAHGIESWEFDVLAALRRAGEPYELSPGRLLRETLVTSGTMTNRVDRLTARGLVERLPDPHDRRGVLVRLTAEGKAAVDGAFEALLAAEADLLADLSDRDRTQLAGLLRSLLAPFS
jgi:DNA-binding MarR family transcriptional regulator